MGAQPAASAWRFCLALLGLVALLAQPVHAANIVVTNNNDVVNGNTASPAALAADPGGDGISLREALLAANNAVGPHTITFNAGLAGQTIALTTRYAAITRDGITLTGLTNNGLPNITLDPSTASNPGPILFIAASSFTMTGIRFSSIPNGFSAVQIGGHAFGLQGQNINAPQNISGFQISGNSFNNGTSSNVFAVYVQHTPNTTSNATISNVAITNNTFNQVFEGINLQGGGSNNIIQDVLIFGNSFSQSTSNGTSAVEVGNTAGTGNTIQRVQVLQNSFTGNFQGIVLNNNSTNSGSTINDTLIARNFFSGNLGALGIAAGVDPASSNNTISNTQIVNNVVELLGWQGNGSATIQVTDSQNGGANNIVNGVSFFNNTIYASGSPPNPGSGFWINSTGHVNNVSIVNDIFWGIQGNTFNNVSPSQVSYSIVNQSGFTGANHNFNSDPLFVNAGAGDFHLQAGSPARAAGLSLGAPPADYDCQARGNPPSIGAFEFNGPAACATNPQTLQLTPAGNIAASGLQGGPFSPASFTYSLASSGGSVGYSISGVPSWLTASATSGTATDSPADITFTVNASTNSLSPGTYGPATITFTNTTNGQGTTTRTATLTVNAALTLVVTPSTNMASSGNQGGTFSPSSFQYQLSATTGSVDFSISGLPVWLSASSTSGTATTSPVTITFSVNSLANSLAYGTYGTIVSFTNTTNGRGDQTRTATLTVNSVGGGSWPSRAYVSAANGSDTGTCPVNAPCGSLNYALGVTDAGGVVTILDGGVFGPIVINKSVTITGNDRRSAQIAADPSPQVGCVGALPSGCGLTNNGFAVEVAAGPADVVKISHMLLSAGPSGAGALKFTSGGQLQLTSIIFRGNASATGPIVALYPSNTGTTQAQVYFSYSDVGFNNNNANAGAVEVKPGGNTSLKLHFNHVEVHNASYGIRTDSSLLSNPSVVVATFVSESEFFSFPNAAVNAFSTSGTGTTNAVFNSVNILNAAVAIKANGPLSSVILTNSTLVGNTIGVQIQNGGTVLTPHDNTVYGNGTDVSGSMTAGMLR